MNTLRLNKTTEVPEPPLYCPVNHARRWWASFVWLGLLTMAVAAMTPGALQKFQKQERAETLAQVLDVAEQAIVMVNERGDVELFSRGAERLFNAHSADVIGRPVDWMIPDEMRESHDRGFKQWWKDGSTSRRVLLDCTAQDFHRQPVKISAKIIPILKSGEWKLVMMVEPPHEEVRIGL
jgi:PAS domain S-box-containing protein